jgi:hypothetical protein
LNPGIRPLVVVASVAAMAIPSLALAGPVATPTPPAPGPQTLTISAAQTTSQASWQKKTWQKSRNFCLSDLNGTPRWRTTIVNGVCGTSVKSQPLVKNQAYTVTVSGLISRWTGVWRHTCGTPISTTDGGDAFNASADPQWTFATKRKKFWCGILAQHLPLVGAGFRVNTTANAAASGWHYPWMNMPRTYVRSNHTYSFTVLGTGQPIAFSIYDHWTVDNHGKFTISIAPATV